MKVPINAMTKIWKWITSGSVDPCLNVLSAERSICLNVGYTWWWGPTLNCCKCKKVTMFECWLITSAGKYHAWMFQKVFQHIHKSTPEWWLDKLFQCWVIKWLNLQNLEMVLVIWVIPPQAGHFHALQVFSFWGLSCFLHHMWWWCTLMELMDQNGGVAMLVRNAFTCILSLMIQNNRWKQGDNQSSAHLINGRNHKR